MYKFRLLKQPHRMNAVWTNISFNVQTMPAITSDIKITVDCPHNKKPFYYSRKKSSRKNKYENGMNECLRYKNILLS